MSREPRQISYKPQLVANQTPMRTNFQPFRILHPHQKQSRVIHFPGVRLSSGRIFQRGEIIFRNRRGTTKERGTRQDVESIATFLAESLGCLLAGLPGVTSRRRSLARPLLVAICHADVCKRVPRASRRLGSRRTLGNRGRGCKKHSSGSGNFRVKSFDRMRDRYRRRAL